MEILKYSSWKMNKRKPSKDFSRFDVLNWVGIPVFMYSYVVLISIISIYKGNSIWLIYFVRKQASLYSLILIIWLVLVYFILNHFMSYKRLYFIEEEYKLKFEGLSDIKKIVRYELFFYLAYILFFLFHIFLGWYDK